MHIFIDYDSVVIPIHEHSVPGCDRNQQECHNLITPCRVFDHSCTYPWLVVHI